VTSLLLGTEQLVRILVCSISIIVAPVTPTAPAESVAEHPVNVTVPKSAKDTRLPPCSKSSTIHSALYSHNEPSEASLEKVWVTVTPVETFLMVATPPVLEDAVTVTVMTLPAAIEMPLKS
jgi:hypothetical protein